MAAVGQVASRSGAAGRQRIRVRLRDVEISSAHGRCTAPDLSASLFSAATLAPGQRVRITGRWRRYDRAAPPGLVPASPERLGILEGRLSAPPEAAAMPTWLSLRSRAAARLAGRLPPDVAPTALALLLAERDEVDPELRRRFASAGLAHLLAISGMHVGLLAAGLVALLGLGMGPRRRLPFALLAVTAYVGLIGAPPAARRALVVIAGYTWARLRGWPAREGELVGAALLAAIVAAPGSLAEPGLQLSFAGYVGVVAGARAGRMVWPGRGRLVSGGRAMAAATGALLATAPLTAFYFGQVTPVSLPAHFVGAPLVAIAIGSLATLLAVPTLLVPPVAAVATGALRVLHAAAAAFAELPGGHRAVPPPAPALWLAWAIVLVGIRRLLVTGRARVLAGTFMLAAGVVAAGPVATGFTHEFTLLCTLSVGQGDAAVLRTRASHWLVFDGGPASGDWDAGTAIVVPFLRRHGAREVDVVVLSHPDLDHLGGLRGLVASLPVRRVLDTGDAVPSGIYAEFLAELDAAAVAWLPAATGDRLRLDEVELLVLGPVREEGGEPREANATSLAFRLTVGNRFRYVNTGDAHAEEEAALLERWHTDSLRADVLKVGHHGSRTSSRVPWLRAVSPRLAVISAGASNRYGHPHAVTLARLDSARVQEVWRTDRGGTLCIDIDDSGRWRMRGERRWREAAVVP